MVGTSARMLALLSLLQSRRDWPGQKLAERLNISSRTVRRDIDRLRELGYAVRAIKGPDGGYRLDAGAELPPLLFDDDQALALAVALQTAPLEGAGLDEAALRALTTLRQVLPSRLRYRFDAIRVTSLAEGADAPIADPAVLLALGAAIRAREIARFDYAAGGTAAVGGASGTPRRVEPHHLVTRRGRWYLVGWDLDRADWRTFRADRITPRSHTGGRFTPRELPGGDVSEFVAGAFKGSIGADRWPCTGSVVLATSVESIAPFVADGMLEEFPADHCRLTLGSWSWNGLASAIGVFDADVSSVEPAELREAFAALGRRFDAAALSPSPLPVTA